MSVPTSAAVSRRNSQPSPYGSWLSNSGLAASAALFATTLPARGLYTSDAAFTDSTTAQASPARSVRPASGTSTNTRSPSAPCAWSVMPISRVPSASVRTHSCDLVYLRSSGSLLMSVLKRVDSGDQGAPEAHERGFDQARPQQLAADVHLHLAGRGRRHAREGDGALER